MRKRPYNTLFIDWVSEIGGAERSMLLLLKHLNRNLFNPIVILPDKGPLYDRITELGVQIKTMPLTKVNLPFPSGYLKTVWRLIRFINRNDIALVTCHMDICNQYALPAARINRVPIVVHTRNLMPDMRSFWRTFLHFPDVLIANSNATAESYSRLIRRYQKVEIIYNAVDLKEFSPAVNGSNIRKRFRIRDDTFLIGMVGRISHLKRQDIFIKAFAEIATVYPNVCCLLVGDTKIDRSENYLKELLQMVQEFGLGDKVIFTGFVNNMRQLYASLDLLVLPSQAEPFGRVLIEAMAMQRPVVATGAGGAVEIVQDGVTGLLVSPDDINGLAKAIMKMLENEEDRTRMGKAGRKRVKNMFSIEKNVEETQKVYMEALN